MDTKASPRLLGLLARSLGSPSTEAQESPSTEELQEVATSALDSHRVDALAHRVAQSPQLAAALAPFMEPSTIRALLAEAEATGDRPKRALEVSGEVVQPAGDALRKLKENGADASLSSKQLRALEAIVRLHGRPSVLVRNGDYRVEDLGRDWEGFAVPDVRTRVRRVIGSVGRVYVAQKKGKGRGMGTAWVGADGVVVTNRHVVVRGLGAKRTKPSGEWSFPKDTRVWVDFLVEEGVGARSEFEVERVLHVEDDGATNPDFALLAIARKTSDGQPLPAPLSIASNLHEVRDAEDHLFTVGYPGPDPEHDADALDRIFGGIYGRKRLAPGAVMEVDAGRSRLLHDCTTLPGSSGSCVVRLAGPSNVVGLHFRGVQVVENEAVLLAGVRERFSSFGLSFVS